MQMVEAHFGMEGILSTGTFILLLPYVGGQVTKPGPDRRVNSRMCAASLLQESWFRSKHSQWVLKAEGLVFKV